MTLPMGAEPPGGRWPFAPLSGRILESGPLGLPSVLMGRLRHRIAGGGGGGADPRSQSSSGARAQMGSPLQCWAPGTNKGVPYTWHVAYCLSPNRLT